MKPSDHDRQETDRDRGEILLRVVFERSAAYPNTMTILHAKKFLLHRGLIQLSSSLNRGVEQPGSSSGS